MKVGKLVVGVVSIMISMPAIVGATHRTGLQEVSAEEATNLTGAAPTAGCVLNSACLGTSGCDTVCSNDPVNTCTKDSTRKYTFNNNTQSYKTTGSFCSDEKCVYQVITDNSCGTTN